MAKNSESLFSIFLSQSTFSEKIIISALTLLFSSASVQVISIPILFKEPLIYCTDPTTNNTFLCSELEACTSKYPYFIDKINGPSSFSSQYDLICENSSQKRMALTMSFTGFLIAATLHTLIIVDQKKRKVLIGLAGIALSLGYFLMILFDFFNCSFESIAYLFLWTGFCVVYVNTFAYVYSSQNLKGELIGITIILLNIFWGVFGILYGILGYISNASWKLLIFAGGVCSFFPALVIFLTKEEEPPKKDGKDEENNQQAEQISIFSYFKDMWKNSVIRYNFFTYTLVWSFFCVIYNVQFVELETVGGSVYFNTVLCCIVEIVAAVGSGILTQKYKCSDLLNISVTTVSIFFIVFIFAPVSLGSSSGLQSYFFIGCLLIAKLFNDLINLMVYLSLPRMFSTKYVALYVVISRGFCRVLMIFMPTLNYIIKLFSIHPFVIYGLFYLVCRFLLSYCKEIEPDGLEDLMNDVNISIVERMAVGSASHSMAGSIDHEEILKNVKVDGVQLSVIRNIKSSQSIKINMEDMNLSSPLLKKITVYDENYEKKTTLYELKKNWKAGQNNV